jgi:hypothetical protein
MLLDGSQRRSRAWQEGLLWLVHSATPVMHPCGRSRCPISDVGSCGGGGRCALQILAHFITITIIMTIRHNWNFHAIRRFI